MPIAELLTKNRSYRRFFEHERIDQETLTELVALSRLCPSSGNRQPLRYLTICSPEDTAKVFPCLRWAGALRNWPGPEEGERPAAYIVILGDMRSPSGHDVDSGIVAQSMLLGAVERGLGGCMVGSIDRERLREAFAIPSLYAVVLVVALGRPKETVVLEEANGPDDIVYWRDTDGVHHVPKRPLSELLVGFGGGEQ